MLGVVFVLLACALWALDTLIRYPLISSGFPSIKLVLIEHGLLVIVFGLLFYKSFPKIFKTKPSNLISFLIVGGLGSGISTIAFSQAFLYLNPSLVILLQKLQPLIAIMFARVVLKESISSKFMFWASICLLGSILISFNDFLSIIELIQNNNSILGQRAFMGYGLVFISVVGWGLATVFGKKLHLNKFSETDILLGRFLFGFICILPLFFVLDQNITIPVNIENISLITLMVFISGILAMFFYYKGLSLISAKNCTLLEMSFPFFAICVNWIFLDSKLNALQILGAILLFSASSIIQIRRL